MSTPLPAARIVRCNLAVREPAPEPVPLGTLLLVAVPLLAFMCALVIPALRV